MTIGHPARALRPSFYRRLKRVPGTGAQLESTRHVFETTPFAAGPWSDRLQHGGPPAALLAHCIERKGKELGFPFVANCTTHMLKPLPLIPLEVDVRIIRSGQKVVHLEASLVDFRTGGGGEFFRSVAYCQKGDTVEKAPPVPEEVAQQYVAPTWPGEEFHFPSVVFNRPECYSKGFQFRKAKGNYGHGPTSMWVRQICDTVEGDDPSLLERMLAIADSGNGMSFYVNFDEFTFVNPTLSLTVLRSKSQASVAVDEKGTSHGAGELLQMYSQTFPTFQQNDRTGWMGVESATILSPNNSTGVATTRLFGPEGELLALGSQSLFLERRPQA